MENKDRIETTSSESVEKMKKFFKEDALQNFNRITGEKNKVLEDMNKIKRYIRDLENDYRSMEDALFAIEKDLAYYQLNLFNQL